MFAQRRKALLVSAALVGGTMLMTACQDSDSGAAKGSSSATPAGTAAAPAPGTAAPTGSIAAPSGASTPGSGQGTGKDSAEKPSGGQNTGAAPGSGDSGTIGKCKTADLKITAMDNTITGDLTGSVAVNLKNIGHNCTISGYPGVDLKTSAGSLSATRTGQETISTVLKADETVSFGINYPINNSGGSGVRITDLLVTPPDETKSVTIPWPGAGTLPVTEGGGTPVTVGPIGSAGQGG